MPKWGRFQPVGLGELATTGGATKAPGWHLEPGAAHHCGACLACLLGIAVVVGGLIVAKNWYLGYYDDAVALTAEDLLATSGSDGSA